jgi:hypothetical protein
MSYITDVRALEPEIKGLFESRTGHKVITKFDWEKDAYIVSCNGKDLKIGLNKLFRVDQKDLLDFLVERIATITIPDTDEIDM